MNNIVSLEGARARRQYQSTSEFGNASVFTSPVSQFIELLEPILESIRDNDGVPGADTRIHLQAYLDLLSHGHREIDELQDMAQFLLQLGDEESGSDQ